MLLLKIRSLIRTISQYLLFQSLFFIINVLSFYYLHIITTIEYGFRVQIICYSSTDILHEPTPTTECTTMEPPLYLLYYQCYQDTLPFYSLHLQILLIIIHGEKCVYNETYYRAVYACPAPKFYKTGLILTT